MFNLRITTAELAIQRQSPAGTQTQIQKPFSTTKYNRNNNLIYIAHIISKCVNVHNTNFLINNFNNPQLKINNEICIEDIIIILIITVIITIILNNSSIITDNSISNNHNVCNLTLQLYSESDKLL